MTTDRTPADAERIDQPPTPERPRALYDQRADVLYLTLADQTAVATEQVLHAFVRRSEEDGEVVGVTIVDFKAQLNRPRLER